MNTENLNLLCMSCFSQQQTPGSFCTFCGYNQASQVESPYQIPLRTILAGKYLVGRVLGEGGFGITYIGYDLNLDIKVAIKEYYPTGLVMRATTVSMTVQPLGGEQGDSFLKGRDRFVDEAKRLARFRTLHGIVMVNDFFVENGTAYIVMEYVEGQTLKTYLTQVGGRLPAAQVFEMLKQVFVSLAQVHESGIIHRDISPDNIMIARDGSAKLLDFGAAREFDEDGNKSLSVVLKHGYAPAEQYSSRGIQGPHTDVYALCATIYRAITGVTPTDSMDRMFEDSLAPPSHLGAVLPDYQEAALMKGLAVRQEDRFRTVSELYDALVGVDGNRPATPPMPPMRTGGSPSAPTNTPPVSPISYNAPQPIGTTVSGHPSPNSQLSSLNSPLPPSPNSQLSSLNSQLPSSPDSPLPKNPNKKIAAIIGICAACIALVAVLLSMQNNNDAPRPATTGPSGTQSDGGQQIPPGEDPSGAGSRFRTVEEREYDAASGLFDRGEYREAFAAFGELGDYMDSAERMLKSRYFMAVQMIDEKDYDGAREHFTAIEDYENSRDMLLEIEYRIAHDLLEMKEYGASYNAFNAIADYSDSRNMLLEVRYLFGIDLLNDGDYPGAIQRFEAVGNYKDSEEQLKESRYRMAESMYIAGKYRSAHEIYKSLAGYKDSAAYMQFAKEGIWSDLNNKVTPIIERHNMSGNAVVSIADISTEYTYAVGTTGDRFVSAGFYAPIYIVARATGQTRANQMMENMDNSAGNRLIDDFGGLSSINSALAREGYGNTTFQRNFGDTAASNRGLENYTDAYDAANILHELYRLGSHTKMKHPLTNDGIRTPSGAEIYAHRGQGIGSAYNVFAVIISGDVRYCISIMTRNSRTANNVTQMITDILSVTYEEMKNP